MLSIKSTFVVAIGLILVNQAAAYKGWGDPACSEASEITGSDCHAALKQFFETSGVYTSVQAGDSVKSFGTCSVTLNVPKEGCQVGQEYLISGENPKLKELGGDRGGMGYLISKCIDNKKSGDVLIFSDPAFSDPGGRAVSCSWRIKIAQNQG